jgi:hypothetical protein
VSPNEASDRVWWRRAPVALGLTLGLAVSISVCIAVGVVDDTSFRTEFEQSARLVTFALPRLTEVVAAPAACR